MRRLPGFWGFRPLFCLLLVTSRLGGSSATSAHGCLFDRRLCSHQEVCIQDGLFGQCQTGAGRVRPLLQVTSPILQRLQSVLRQLMSQGLSWQDDLTQYVISQEMERIPRLRPPDPGSKDRSGLASRRPALPGELLPPGLPTGSSPAAQHRLPRPLLGGGGGGAGALLPSLPADLLPPLLEHLLLPPQPPLPALSYEPTLLQPYLFHQFASQESSRALENPPGLVTVVPQPKAEASALFNRAAKNAFGAHPGLSYRNPPGPVSAQLFQDPGLLYLAQEPPASVRLKGQRLQEQAGNSQGGDSPQTYGEEGIGGTGEREPEPSALTSLSPGPQPADVVLQRLAAVLANYGVELKQLSREQLTSLYTLMQLLPKGAGKNRGEAGNADAVTKKIMEGDMQHTGDSREPPSATASLSEFPAGGDIPVRAQGAAVAGPSEPPPSLGMPVLMEKKSPLGQKGLSGGDQPLAHSAEEYGYIVTDQKPLGLTAGVRLLETLAEHIHMSSENFINISVVGSALTFRIRNNEQNVSLADVTQQAGLVKSELEAETGFRILQTGVGQREEAAAVLPRPARGTPPLRSVLLTLVALAGVAGLLVAAALAVCLRQHGRLREKERLAALGPEGAHADTTLEYQELCRQHMASKSLFSRSEGPPEPSRVSSISSQFSDAAQASPSSHSSTPSWCEEPAQANMDISTGHMILAYMEDHLRNRDRLAKEWQALCAYQAEPNACSLAQGDANLKKNRNPDFVPYDHARIKLKVESSPSRSDYINASPIIEHDPRMPAYIATQGPLSHTISDFWQMVWENGCTVIVMLAPLVEDGVKQCDRYWPDEGSSLYHVYEVNLVSEHIWCEDFLVRSFYLKNVQSQETRTLTQFHFLSWPAEGTPTSTRPLLDFRRKVNKCYRGRSCPIIVHCSDGAGRTGTYILIDMVLNRMAKGVKEIDIAATLEHVRDQRPGLVRTKDQFEFALTAVAEEVNAILKALPQ
ncbi:receptor-type tyrosine-protein phosphatase-like N isoform X1 [Sminthopsis crassicaudata]|uniref:receptor-type tyrosine-protein phosphatase-like N isoform X1 n=1 Tax=Sminthopsis crassicaudata TaxID=9301 RepID=UPI003D692D2E